MRLSPRAALTVVLGVSTVEPSAALRGPTIARVDRGETWPLGRFAFSLLPLAGAERRKTIESTVVRDRVWTHDQVQGLLHVVVPVRQTVVSLSEQAGGGLLVYNPVAPTGECVEMMKRLEARHGPVRHVVIGSLGLEHTAFGGPFARAFSEATVWLQRGLWSYPVNLPPELLGYPVGRVRTIPDSRAAGDEPPPPWATDFDYELLGPLRFKSVGSFGEAALVHRATSTLLLTDSESRRRRQARRPRQRAHAQAHA